MVYMERLLLTVNGWMVGGWWQTLWLKQSKMEKKYVHVTTIRDVLIDLMVALNN